MPDTFHNPDRYMSDLRQILAQGRKRIGILLGAGAPAGIKVNKVTMRLDPNGDPLIPAVAGLTSMVLNKLSSSDRKLVDELFGKGSKPNVEAILSKLRSLSTVLGDQTVHGRDGNAFREVALQICAHIGEVVKIGLPQSPNPYTELVGWIGGTDRAHPIEIFTSNYDLLMEEALERSRMPFYDGFCGSWEPFFDPSSISNDDLPARWSRLWKLHGSIGWKSINGRIMRGAGRDASEMIYPDHLKYEQTQKLPFTAFFDRLRRFLSSDDTLLLACGFSFFDAHISAVIEESLNENANAAVFALQFQDLEKETSASALAQLRSNFSVYARDAAIIRGVKGRWHPGDLISKDWPAIRESFWSFDSKPAGFLLGDFEKFCRFFALSTAKDFSMPYATEETEVEA